MSDEANRADKHQPDGLLSTRGVYGAPEPWRQASCGQRNDCEAAQGTALPLELVPAACW